MLNFESVGNPIAKIIDKRNTKKEQIVIYPIQSWMAKFETDIPQLI